MSCSLFLHNAWMLLIAFVVLLQPFCESTLQAQVNLANRPISGVKVAGLQRHQEQLVLNQIRAVKGRPYDPAVIKQDVRRIAGLGRFASMILSVEPQNDGTLVLIYTCNEKPLLSDVIVEGNTRLHAQDILGAPNRANASHRKFLVRPGDPADEDLILAGQRQIVGAYRQAGFFAVDVAVDRQRMLDESVLHFRVSEGPRVTIRKIEFTGPVAIDDQSLAGQLDVQARNLFNRDSLDKNVGRLGDFYRSRGYLDAEAGRRFTITPDEKQADIQFVVHEGSRYTIAAIRVEDAKAFTPQKIGEVCSTTSIADAAQRITDMYGARGFVDVALSRAGGQAGMERIFHVNEPKVDLVVRVVEGRPALAARVMIRGNQAVKEKDIRKSLRGVEPSKPYDKPALVQSLARLREDPRIASVDFAILNSEEKARDMIVWVREKDGANPPLELQDWSFDASHPLRKAGQPVPGKPWVTGSLAQHFQANANAVAIPPVAKDGSPESQMKALAQLLADGRADAARAAADDWIARYPSHPQVDEATMLRGDAHAKAGHLQAALSDYERLVRTYPASKHYHATLQRQADLARRMLGDKPAQEAGFVAAGRRVEPVEVACEVLHRVAARADGSEVGERALLTAGDALRSLQRFDAAARDYEAFLKSYSKSAQWQQATRQLNTPAPQGNCIWPHGP